MKGGGEAKRTAKSILYMALDLTETALDGLPIPGAKGIFGTVISTLKQVDTTNSNAETLDALSKHVDSLRSVALAPLSGKSEADINPELNRDTESLANDLNALLKPWTKRQKRKGLIRFITANEDQGDLQALSDDIGRAIERFQVLLLNHIREHQLDEQDDRLVNGLIRAKYASFDSTRTRKIGACLEGTRSDVLQKIRTWVESEGVGGPRIFWLKGMAGLGKTSIARSVAEWARASKILGANFFFARDEQDLRNAALLFPTLAFQLAKFDPQYQRQLAKALSEGADLDHLEFATQFEQLIQNPLIASHQSSKTNKTMLIVIDAIDECASETSVEELLHILITKSGAIPQKFVVFLTSRPEPYIDSAFRLSTNGTKSAGFVPHDIEDSVVQRDIEAYLAAELSRLPVDLGITLPEGWPRGKDFKLLADLCGRFFVFAATALRFIFDKRVRNPMKQLGLLLGDKDHRDTSVNPYSTLDKLYLDVLLAATLAGNGEGGVERIRLVLGTTVVLRNPLPLTAFAAVVLLAEEDIFGALQHLHSIIAIQGDDAVSSSPRFLHPSFHDFITDPHRCADDRFWVDAEVDETRMFIRCLDIMMSGLTRDPLNIVASGRSAKDVRREESNVTIERAFPPLLRYACEFWPVHLKGGKFRAIAVIEKLKTFTKHFLLYWLEAAAWLELIDKISVVTREISVLLKDVDEGTSSLLHDTRRYILYNRLLLAQDPLEVYRSALAFVPTNTELFLAYHSHVIDSVLVVRGLDVNWPLLVATLPHTDEVTCINYAHDGSRIATGTSAGLITLWDARSGARKLSIDTNVHHAVRHIHFSRDDTLIASTNVTESSVFVWDALSGTRQSRLVGHIDAVNGLDFKLMSTGNHILASASQDTYIRVWSIDSGGSLLQVPVLDPFTFKAVPVTSITFVRSGNEMISSSYDKTIRLWHSVSGNQIWCYSHSSHINANAILPKDGLVVFGDDNSDLYVASIGTAPEVNPPTKILAYYGQNVQALFPSSNENGMTVSIEGYGLQMVDLEKRKIVEATPYPTPQINHVAYRTSGLTAVSIEGERSCALWNSSWRLDIVDYGDHKGEVTALAFSDDASMLATGGGAEDCTVRIWVATDGQHFDTLEGHTGAVRLLIFSPTNELIASASDDGFVRLWGIDKGNCLAAFGPHGIHIKHAKLSFREDGAEVYLRTSLGALSWNVPKVIDSHESGARGGHKGDAETSDKNPTRFSFSSLGRVPSRNSIWFVRFDGAGKEREVAITAPGVLVDGPIAYCRDRVAICRSNGKFLLIDVSKLIQGIDLPNFSSSKVTHINPSN